MVNNFCQEEEENPFKVPQDKTIEEKLRQFESGNSDELTNKANEILLRLEGQYTSLK